MCSWFIVGFSIRWLSHFLAPVALTWRICFGVSSCFCACLYFVWPHFIMLWSLCRLSVRIYCMCSYFWMILLCVLLLVLRCTCQVLLGSIAVQLTRACLCVWVTQEARPGWILYHIFVWCLDIVSHAVDIEEVSPIACDIVLHHVKVVGLSCWLLL